MRKQGDQQEAIPRSRGRGGLHGPKRMLQRGREGEELKTYFRDKIMRMKRWTHYTWKEELEASCVYGMNN